jgi:hypothetical protein
MDWFLLGALAVIGIGVWLYFRKPAEPPEHTTDFVADKGMASSFMGDGRRDSVERAAEPHYPEKRQ